MPKQKEANQSRVPYIYALTSNVETPSAPRRVTPTPLTSPASSYLSSRLAVAPACCMIPNYGGGRGGKGSNGA